MDLIWIDIGFSKFQGVNGNRFSSLIGVIVRSHCALIRVLAKLKLVACSRLK